MKHTSSRAKTFLFLHHYVHKDAALKSQQSCFFLSQHAVMMLVAAAPLQGQGVNFQEFGNVLFFILFFFFKKVILFLILFHY